MSMPLVAIIILNWNGMIDTINCLRSLNSLDYPNYKILVVDNGSTHNEAEELKAKFDENIVFIRSEENLGYSGGNNLGLRKALDLWNPKYFLLMNNDIIIEKNFLLPMVDLLEKHNDIGVVGPMIINGNEPNKISSMGAVISKVTGLVKLIGNGQLVSTNQFVNNIKVDYVSGCALLARTKMLNEIGYLDSRYFLYAEERDWCTRARIYGYICICIPKCKVWHNESSSTKKSDGLKEYYMTRNQILFLKKHYKGWQCFLATFISLTVYFIIILKNSIKTVNYILLKAFLKGLTDGILGKYYCGWKIKTSEEFKNA